MTAETPAQHCLRLAHDLSMSDHMRLWEVIAAARRQHSDPRIRDLHKRPSVGEYWDQVRRELGDLSEIDGLARLYVDL